MEELKVGEIVKLKSGNPGMTVQTIYDSGNARCQWFENGKAASSIFPKESLEKDSGGSGFEVS
ncbi:MAG TPA: DUF2158 domain-containing protein [Pyrinomonadaceae bacterium]|jgi:uncharacterized protein YodC (DUF2158 family)